MSFSVGVLYSCQDMVGLVSSKGISPKEFTDSFKTFTVAAAGEVLEMSQRCSWVALTLDGTLAVTERGKSVLGAPSRESALRVQIKHAIEIFQPAWAQRMRNGREEVKEYFPSDIKQCFKEADLLDDWTDEMILWWDDLAQAARAKKNDELLQIGRKAERLSMEYESKRTGILPRWQSLESNFSGYDILSRVNGTDTTPLRIEVKGSSLSHKQAYVFITRNEWTVAKTIGNYKFHFWLIARNPPLLIEKDHADIATHIPTDQGGGEWQNVRIQLSKV